MAEPTCGVRSQPAFWDDRKRLGTATIGQALRRDRLSLSLIGMTDYDRATNLLGSSALSECD